MFKGNSSIHSTALLLLSALWGVLWMGGCAVTEEEGQFACQTDADCPSGWQCNIGGDGHCYSPERMQALSTDDSSTLWGSDSSTGLAGSDDTNTSVVDTADTVDTTDSGSVATDDSEVDTSVDTDTPTEADTTVSSDLESDSEPPTDSDGPDSESDTATADSDSGTGGDSGIDADTVSDDSDTGVDTETDTVEDTQSGNDTSDSDTGADTGTETDTDTGSDTGVDTGSDTLSTNSCSKPILIASSGDTWQGNWSEYGGAFSQSNPSGCGEGQRDVWFLVSVPAKGNLAIQETTASMVVIREISDCTLTSCTGYSDSSEIYEISNKANVPRTILIIVSEAPGNSEDAFSVNFVPM
ncbi:MAG: hypothetical protein JXX14_22540 [Deltaproteobacteria bacterium]|nr:hypothetical protein [Deltaproteobacteria bacterium]